MSELKLGERVQISMGYQASDRERQIGRQGTLIAVPPKSKNYPFAIQFDDGYRGVSFFEHEVESIESKEKNDITILPVESQARKNTPMCSGVLDYFPAALAEVARVSYAGNEKHNPGQALHHARGKSNDHADCILRHLTERGTMDPEDDLRHSAKLAWRALALLQEELEAAGAPMARGASKE